MTFSTRSEPDAQSSVVPGLSPKEALMNVPRIEAALTEDRKLTLEVLPFRAGDTVEVIVLERAGPNEDEQVADWLTASKRSLQEVWDNDEDAVYDHV